jgi:hypothetical protein
MCRKGLRFHERLRRAALGAGKKVFAGYLKRLFQGRSGPNREPTALRGVQFLSSMGKRIPSKIVESRYGRRDQ